MKTIGTFISHNIKQFFNSKISLFLLICPVVISSISMLAFEGSAPKSKAKVSLYSQDQSGIEEKLIKSLQEKGIEVNRVDKEEEVKTQVETNTAQMGIILRAKNTFDILGKGQDIIQTVYKASDYNSKNSLRQLQQSLTTFLNAKSISGDNLGVFNKVYEELSENVIEVKVQDDEKSALKKVSFGILVLLIILTAMQCLMPVIKEKESSVYDRIGIAPIKKSEYLIGHLLGCIIILFIQLIIQGVLMAALKMNFGLSLKDFFGLTLTAGVVGTGIGLLFLTLVPNSKIYASTMGVVIMPLCMISDCLFPIEMLPDWLGKVAYLSPVRWVMIAYKDRVAASGGQEMLGSIGIALMITCVLVLMSLVLDRRLVKHI